MLRQDIFAVTDPERIRDLIRTHAWATLISHVPDRGMTVSHLPVLVADGGPGDALVLTGHLARTDAEEHQLGAHDVVLVFQGPHGYLSPVWYEATPHVPTWNFVVAHVHGRPVVLGPEHTYGVLTDTVDHFEGRFPEPWRLERVDAYAHRIAAAVTGFTLTAARVTAKAKLSQDESDEVVHRVVAALTADQPYAHPQLARAMRDSRRQQ
ncbi:FMN-binding negative transcriptional regulator [Streptomyces corynorhini]|uniref:FMN-binding negative transcriptional regulator n=1 Tax=Streptomyces corynorhini TaxID=2282652 RepID=A0A370AUP8_9ACTN|nr:FMN-binding negative transcriptional regulator [Streptomyces corynorhini]RDG30835.1 FMN-binding negative transcriptional regulator [Streptomyces corynorhini]